MRSSSPRRSKARVCILLACLLLVGFLIFSLASKPEEKSRPRNPPKSFHSPGSPVLNQLHVSAQSGCTVHTFADCLVWPHINVNEIETETIFLLDPESTNTEIDTQGTKNSLDFPYI